MVSIMFNMSPKIGNDWDTVLEASFKEPEILTLFYIIDSARRSGQSTIYPPAENVFDALKYTPLSEVKVVILGQDPYINPGQAHGLAFSVPPGIEIPPSLLNIFKELNKELGCYIPNNGCLIPWAKQGVLLLNSILTVEQSKSKSHAGIGWEKLTDKIIKIVSDKPEPCVFMLWGNDAKSKAKLIDSENNLVLMAAHPSPLAGGAFFGCNHFTKCNDFLYDFYSTTIDWQIPNI